MDRDKLRSQLQHMFFRKSMGDCERETGVKKNTISRFCRGKQIRAATLEKLAQWARDQEQSK